MGTGECAQYVKTYGHESVAKQLLAHRRTTPPDSSTSVGARRIALQAGPGQSRRAGGGVDVLGPDPLAASQLRMANHTGNNIAPSEAHTLSRHVLDLPLPTETPVFPGVQRQPNPAGRHLHSLGGYHAGYHAKINKR